MLAGCLVILAATSIWSVVELRKLSNVRREVALLRVQLDNADRTIENTTRAIDGLQDAVATIRSLEARVSLDRRAERPATQLDIKALGWRLDLIENRLRDISIHSTTGAAQ